MRPDFKKGFTLTEMLVVLVCVSILAGGGVFYGIDSYLRTTFRSDRDILVAALQRARSQSVGNICLGVCTDGKPHGVYISLDAHGNVQYTIFQGTSFATADHAFDDVISTNPNTTWSGIREVTFEQLSGGADASGKIVLQSSSGKISTTTVGSEGEITWTN